MLLLFGGLPPPRRANARAGEAAGPPASGADRSPPRIWHAHFAYRPVGQRSRIEIGLDRAPGPIARDALPRCKSTMRGGSAASRCWNKRPGCGERKTAAIGPWTSFASIAACCCARPTRPTKPNSAAWPPPSRKHSGWKPASRQLTQEIAASLAGQCDEAAIEQYLDSTSESRSHRRGAPGVAGARSRPAWLNSVRAARRAEPADQDAARRPPPGAQADRAGAGGTAAARRAVAVAGVGRVRCGAERVRSLYERDHQPAVLRGLGLFGAADRRALSRAPTSAGSSMWWSEPDRSSLSIVSHPRRTPTSDGIHCSPPRWRPAPASASPGRVGAPRSTGVRAIVGQQVSVRGASTVTARIIERAGRPVPGFEDLGLTHTFPDPATLSQADLTAIGMSTPRSPSDQGVLVSRRQGRRPPRWPPSVSTS